MPDFVATLVLLIGLELVLGVDNIVVITIVVSRLPEEARRRARWIGLVLALVARLIMVAGFSWVLSLSEPVVAGMSVRDLILLAGGGFLLWKAVREIHHTVELIEDDTPLASAAPKSQFATAIAMIVGLDLVFAIDSVVTAVGLTDDLLTIGLAVILSFVVLLLAAEPIGEFVLKNPTFKILALSFLVTIGIMLLLEAFHHEVPKAYIYLPMGFATVIQLLQWRLMKNQRRESKS